MIDLANELASRHELTICCVKRLGALAESVDPRIDIHCLGKGEGNDLQLPFRLARLLREKRIDILHTHNWGVFLEGALAASFAGTAVRVHTVHGPTTPYGPDLTSQLKRVLRHWLERHFSRQFKKIVTVSNSIQNYVRTEIGIDGTRLTTIHNGINISALTAQRSRNEQVVCITVGRLVEIKNQEMMIRAFHKAHCLQACLWIVGDGPERVRLESISKELQLGDRVKFVGFRQDVATLLERSNIFLLSSNYEGISIAVLEAMRAALPVVGTRVGGMPETIQDGHNGLLVEAQDIESMAAAIRRLVESPEECARLGTAGRQCLEEEFSIATMVRRYEQIYLSESK